MKAPKKSWKWPGCQVEGTENCQNFTTEIWNPYLETPTPDGNIQIGGIESIDCEDRCNWLSNLFEQGFKPKIALYFENESLNDCFHNKITTKIDVREGLIDISIDSKATDQNLTVSLCTLTGQKLAIEELTLSKGSNFMDLPLGNVPSGLYIIAFNLDGYLICTEKIIIIR